MHITLWMQDNKPIIDDVENRLGKEVLIASETEVIGAVLELS